MLNIYVYIYLFFNSTLDHGGGAIIKIINFIIASRTRKNNKLIIHRHTYLQTTRNSAINGIIFL